MPIRKRLSDPFSDDVAKFERRMKYGAPPPTPPKPSLKEREAFVRELMNYPEVGKMLEKDKFFRTWADRYMTLHFKIWGQDLFILPGHALLDERFVRVAHPTIRRINPDRRGIRPMLRLKGEPRTWYSQVLHWIEDTVWDA